MLIIDKKNQLANKTHEYLFVYLKQFIVFVVLFE